MQIPQPQNIQKGRSKTLFMHKQTMYSPISNRIIDQGLSSSFASPIYQIPWDCHLTWRLQDSAMD